MILSFHGADRNVTGSCHLLEAGGVKILVDYGLDQGAQELVEENSRDFGHKLVARSDIVGRRVKQSLS